ncbi:MAG TPA: gluconokinase [Acidimicrobiales bacterium]|nr:gluconokinase [Acidimicrobiales bacterium]
MNVADQSLPAVRSIVVMGVAGSGKSTVARALAARLDYEFIDADWLHSPENIEKMSSGHPLNDDDRSPWLHAVGQRIESESRIQRGTVTACSALKRSYRDLLRLYVPDAFFVYLEGSREVIQARIEARRRQIVGGSLLASQFDILEVPQDDERGLRVDIRRSPEAIVNVVVSALAR